MEAYGDFALIYDQLINEDINYKEYAKFILEKCKENGINFNNYLDLACEMCIRDRKHTILDQVQKMQ